MVGHAKVWGAGVAAVVALLALTTALAVSAGAASEPQLVGGLRPETPDVSGRRVVWTDNVYGSYDIFLYDATTGVTSRLTTTPDDEIDPSISGDTVVFTRATATGRDIYAVDVVTRTTSIVSNAAGDQVNASIAGSYVAWEDRGSGYLPSIYVRRLPSGTPVRIASGYSSGFRRPRASGQWVVYEAYPAGSADDADVHAYNLVTGEKVTVAAGSGHERVPSTDGRYVVWCDGNGEDPDIAGFDLSSRQPIAIRTQPGEQTLPVVAGGIAYWIDNAQDGRIHVDTLDIGTGKFAAFNSMSVAEMAGVAADGDSIAWLEPAGDGRWQVRARLGAAQAAASAATAPDDILPLTPAWQPFRLAQVATDGDTKPPRVEHTSVAPGERNVAGTGPLSVYFSEPIDPATVSEDSVTLADESGSPVQASVRYSALTDAVTLTPDAALGEGTFVLSVSSDVTDRAGNPLAEQLVVPFATDDKLADTQVPSKPGNVVARVNGLGGVELSWNASRDDSGIAAYRIYRYFEPIEPANLASAALVDSAPGNVTTYTVATKATAPTESDARYTFFYAMIAEDTVGKLSDLSVNNAPDPHGTYVYGKNTNNCIICHTSVHGAAPVGWWALGAKSAQACYVCHGGTAMTTAYGHGSTYNTQARFWDYTSDPLPEGGTRHGNSYMDAQNETCDACHSAHKRPYNQPSGSYEASTSYAKLLKRPADPADAGSALLYFTADGAVAFDKAFCFACHGAGSGGALTYMTAKAGASAYSNTAGDHNQAQFDDGTNAVGLAHHEVIVQHTLRGSNDPGPLNNCTACHNEHASPTGSLADYRQSNTTAATYDQAGLCFACHSATSTETRSTGSAPFSWNGRDVKAQFQRSSAHPISAMASSAVPQVGAWAQTTQAEFAGDVLTGTTALADGSGTSGQVQLAEVGGGLYTDAGTVVSTPIANTSGGTFNGWTELTFSGCVPAGASMTVDILDAGDDSVLVSGLTLAQGQSGYPLSMPGGIDPVAYPSLKLRANLAGDGGGGPSSVTPSLFDWQITYVYTLPATGASLTCYNCHNTHYVRTAGTSVWSMARASDPDNTRSTFAGTPTQFCLRCHDSAPPTAQFGAGVLVPYSVGMSEMSAYPFFGGWNKTAAGAEWASGAHITTTLRNMSVGCDNCHDPHASDNDRLTAFTRGQASAHSAIARDGSSTWAEENLCFGCHTSNRTPNCAGGMCHTSAINAIDVEYEITRTYRHDVNSATMAGRHSDTEDADGLGTSNRHVECVDCHDPHAARAGVHTVGSARHGEAVRGATGIMPSAWPGNWTAVSGEDWTPERMTGQDGDYESYVCFKCHSSYTTLPTTGGSGGYGGTDTALEFNPNNQSGHNVVGDAFFPKTTTTGQGEYDGLPYTFGTPDLNLNTAMGWSDVPADYDDQKMTCSDCHSYDGTGARGPHGSSSKFLTRPYAAGQTGDWWNVTLGGWNSSNFLCRRCHTSRTTNTAHDEGDHATYTCGRCHVRIPHGWKRPRLLRYDSDPAPYVAQTDGLTGFDYKDYTGDLSAADCDGCHHGVPGGNEWP